MRAKDLLGAYTKEGVEMSGAAVDMRTFRAQGARNIYIANQFLWGPGFFVSSAMVMAGVVSRALKSIYGGDAPSEAKG